MIKIKLSALIDGRLSRQTAFTIFKDKDKLEMLRVLAQKTGPYHSHGFRRGRIQDP